MNPRPRPPLRARENLPRVAGRRRARRQEHGQEPEGDNDLSLGFDDLARDRFLIGSPDEVAEQVVSLHRRTGANHIIASMQWPGTPLQASMDSMRMLAEEVFPRVAQGL